MQVASDGLHAALRVQASQTNPTGNLYGGTAVAASIAMMESCSGRAATWVTVQFTSSCRAGEVIDLVVSELAAGRRTSQLRLSGTVEGREIFAALGAMAVHADGGPSEGPGHGQWESMPRVPTPDACPPLLPPSSDRALTYSQLGESDVRVAIGFDQPPAAQVALWCRPHQAGRLSNAVLGWQADLLGMALVKASGWTGATSLDNTIRFGPPSRLDVEWVLMDLRAHVLVDGYGHGSVFAWSPDGTLLAIASQTCVMRPPRPQRQPPGRTRPDS